MVKNKQPPIRFWSSVEYASIMSPIVRELQALGYDAEHRFFIRSADYRSASSFPARSWLRLRMYLLYPIYFLWMEGFSPSSHCVICTNTFYAPLLSTFLKGRNRSSIHLLYDLFPDALVAAGKLSPSHVVARLARRVVDATFARSSANVILGQRLKQHIAHRLPNGIPNQVIPVGTDCRAFPDLAMGATPGNPLLSLLYCGNLGHLHDFETVVACLADDRVKELPLSLRFCGNGAGMEQLKEKLSGHESASFSAGLKADEWVDAMSASPIGLVTMRPGAQTILLPSKTYSAMAAGQAILAICPLDSDLADLVRTHDCGWLVEPGDAPTLAATLEAIATAPEDLHRKRRNAQAAAREHYDARPVAQLWVALFESLAAPQCRTQS